MTPALFADGRLSFQATVEYGLAWLVEYPLIPIAYSLLLAVSYNALGKGLGLVDLFWHEKKGKQFLVGVFSGGFIGQLLLTRYLLGQPFLPWDWFVEHVSPVTYLYPDAPHEYRVQGLYFLFYPLGLVLIGLPAFFRADVRPGPGERLLPRRWPLLVGLAISFALVARTFAAVCGNPSFRSDLTATFLSYVAPVVRRSPELYVIAGLAAVAFAQVFGRKRRWAVGGLGLVLVGGWFAWALDADPAGYQPVRNQQSELDVLFPRAAGRRAELHAAMFLFSVTMILSLAALRALARRGFQSPVLTLIALLAIATGGYEYVATQGVGRQWLVFVLIIGWAWLASLQPYKIRLPDGFESLYRAQSARPPEPVPEAGADLGTFTPSHPLPAGAVDEAQDVPDLLASPDLIARAAENWQAHRPGLPKLVILAASGGGIRAAVWACAVLEELASEGRRLGLGPVFPEQIRLMTGASGGMVGAAYYTAYRAFGRAGLPAGVPADTRCPLAWATARDSLGPVMSTMLFHDLPGIWVPGPSPIDRGRALDRSWEVNTAPADGTPSPWSRPVADLSRFEQRALVPSLIFSPMLVEDARRLLISNLDLDDIGTSGPRATPAARPAPLLSRSAVELFRHFRHHPAVRAGLRLSTAARMNASFPIISPAVCLPMDPVRRAVDAGYYDNYGVDIATEWVYRYRNELLQHTSGVLVLQVRAYPSEMERQNLLPAGATASDALGALRWLASPIEGVWNMREKSPWYRNDERLASLANLFAAAKHPDFFRTEYVECVREAPLSWYMTTGQTEAVVRDAGQAVARLLARLRSWF